MTYQDELEFSALRRKINALETVAWIQGCVLIAVVVFLMALPSTYCKCSSEDKANKPRKERISMPYQRNRRPNNGE